VTLVAKCRWVARRVTVAGASMEPALSPGDRLLFFPPLSRLRPGDIVAVPDPRQPARLLVKRVTSLDGRFVSVEGDNPDESTDSRVFGPVERRAILGRAVYRYAPAGRVGPVGSGR
jgi:nickel-type superoxide dismutase maturation protease